MKRGRMERGDEHREDNMEEEEEDEYNIGVGIGDVTGPAAEIAMVSQTIPNLIFTKSYYIFSSPLYSRVSKNLVLKNCDISLGGMVCPRRRYHNFWDTRFLCLRFICI